MSSACPVCSGTVWYPHLTAHDLYTGDPWDVVCCAGCGLGRTVVPVELLAAPESLYEVAGDHDAGARFGGPVEVVMRQLRRWRVRAVTRHRAAPGRILDVGCGRAVLLQALADVGWDVYGTELSAAIAASATAALGERIFVGPLEDIDVGELRFDVISLFHVLEHLQDPRAALARARELLAPGGQVIIGVPNLDSWQARAFGGHWLHLDVPRHLWHFSDVTLRELARQLGLTTAAREHFSFEYGPYGMFQGALASAGLGNALFSRLLRRPGAGHRLADPAFWAHASLAGPIAAAGVASLPVEALAAAAGHGGAITLVLEAFGRVAGD